MSKLNSAGSPGTKAVSSGAMSKAAAPAKANTAIKPVSSPVSKAVSKTPSQATKPISQPAAKTSVARTGVRAQNKVAAAKLKKLPAPAKGVQRKALKTRKTKSNVQKSLSKLDVNSQRYKQLVAKKAEKAVDNSLRRNHGFQFVRSFAHNRVHGIDKIAYNKDARGRITKAAAIEVKGSNNAKNKLHPSSFKKQTNSHYVKKNLRKADSAGIRDARQLYEMARKGKMEVKLGTYNLRNDMNKGPKFHSTFVPRKPVKRVN